MTDVTVMSLDEIESLAFRALTNAGTSPDNARLLSSATAATEADGIASHGLAYIPIYCEHVRCGKVDGQAKPQKTEPTPAVVTVDAATGFAHPAIDLGFEMLIPMARKQGVAALAVSNSYNCGVLGFHTQRLATEGLLGIGFTNAPASIAPVGGKQRVVGTNPFSLAVPDGRRDVALLIDQSASVVARSEIMKRAREGSPIPPGWALDEDGAPTTDATAALKGSMAPAGGYKGVGVALLVEVMAAAMTGATLGIKASPFSGTQGGPPRTGQFFMAIDPAATAGGQFADRIIVLADAMRSQPGVRVPGDGRRSAREIAKTEGIAVSNATLAKIKAEL